MADGVDLTLPATMADLKSIETLIGSTIDAKFLELQNLILALKDSKDPVEKLGLEDSQNSVDGDTEEEIEKKEKG